MKKNEKMPPIGARIIDEKSMKAKALGTTCFLACMRKLSIVIRMDAILYSLYSFAIFA